MSSSTEREDDDVDPSFYEAVDKRLGPPDTIQVLGLFYDIAQTGEPENLQLVLAGANAGRWARSRDKLEFSITLAHETAQEVIMSQLWERDGDFMFDHLILVVSKGTGPDDATRFPHELRMESMRIVGVEDVDVVRSDTQVELLICLGFLVTCKEQRNVR